MLEHSSTNVSSLLGPQFAVEINERMWNRETGGQPRAWGTGNRRHGKARVKYVTYLRHKNKASNSKRERRFNMMISTEHRDKSIQLGMSATVLRLFLSNRRLPNVLGHIN